MDTITLTNVSQIKVKWNNNLNKQGYLPDIHTVKANNVDVTMTTWMFEGKSYYELHLEWFSKSVRPLVKNEVNIFSDHIINLSIVP